MAQSAKNGSKYSEMALYPHPMKEQIRPPQSGGFCGVRILTYITIDQHISNRASTDPRSIEAEVGVCGSNAAAVVVVAEETEQLEWRRCWNNEIGAIYCSIPESLLLVD